MINCYNYSNRIEWLGYRIYTYILIEFSQINQLEYFKIKVLQILSDRGFI